MGRGAAIAAIPPKPCRFGVQHDADGQLLRGQGFRDIRLLSGGQRVC